MRRDKIDEVVNISIRKDITHYNNFKINRRRTLINADLADKKRIFILTSQNDFQPFVVLSVMLA